MFEVKALTVFDNTSPTSMERMQQGNTSDSRRKLMTFGSSTCRNKKSRNLISLVLGKI
jgi:hypothetical protein